MIDVAMAYHRPSSVEEAAALLEADPEARLLAGGQSLVAMLNLGLFAPSALIDLARVDGLRGIRRGADGSVTLGAMTTHAEISESDAFLDGQRLLPTAARQIADPAVRNFGTIGGACGHGDSIGDWPPALVAAGATFIIAGAGAGGVREVAASDFFLGLFSTALGPTDILMAIRIPPLAGRAAYCKFSRVESDYATVSVAVVASAQGGLCKTASIAVGSCAPVPVRLAKAEALLIGAQVDAARARRAGALLADAINPITDVRGSAAYRRRVVPDLVARTVLQVLANE